MNLSNVMLGDKIHPALTAPLTAAIAMAVVVTWSLKRGPAETART
jgi:hypothetical protein